MSIGLGYHKLAEIARGAADEIGKFLQEGNEEINYALIERFSAFLGEMNDYYKRKNFIPPVYGIVLHKAMNATEVFENRIVSVKELASKAKALSLELIDYQNLSTERARALRDFSNRVYDNSMSSLRG